MNLILPIYSIFLLVLLLIVFYSKRRIKTSETKIYGILIIISLFNVIFNIVGIYVGYTSQNIMILNILNHLDLPLYFWWISLLFIYFLYIKFNNIDQLKYIKYKCIVLTLGIVFTTISMFLPFKVIITDTAGYAIGVCVNFVYMICSIYILLCIIMSILIVRQNKIKKAIPIFAFIFLGVLAALIQKNIPSLIIVPSVIVLVLFIMYFTIENPDVKMIEEIEKNREITDKSIEDKANMLFKISQDVKTPVLKIQMLSNKIKRNDEIDEIHNDARDINELSRDVNNTINKVLDISNFDISNFKVSDISYNIYNVFKELVILVKERINDNIDFKYHMSSTVPNKLYGDSLKIKQIMYTTLLNAIEHTEKGIIDLNVEAINRNDVCRLIIEVSNTGKEIDAYEINEILKSDDNLKKDEIDKIKDLDIGLKLTKKIIDMLGGSLLIKSNVTDGTTFTIIINQGIVNENNSNNMVLSNKSKVLLICDDYQELEKLSLELKKNNLLVTTSLYGMDLIKEINNNKKYDYIFIDDEMEPINAVEIMKKIKEHKENIIVMLNNDKEAIKDHYLKDYNFSNYLLKNSYKEEIKRIINNKK